MKSGTYFIRAKDSVGNYSAAATIPSVQVELPEPQDLEVVQTYTENPSFTGTFERAFNSVTEGGISLSGGHLIKFLMKLLRPSAIEATQNKPDRYG